jgi:SanA protein
MICAIKQATTNNLMKAWLYASLQSSAFAFALSLASLAIFTFSTVLWYNASMSEPRYPKLTHWLALGSIAAVLLGLPRWAVVSRYRSQIHSLEDAPSMPTAIVLGAGLRRDGYPTTVLADRVTTAVRLYSEGKVEQILMSGSTRFGRNEPEAMKSLAVQQGVATEDILIDTLGDRTYSTCLRAKLTYGLQSVLIITQRFHLPRALAICEALGLNANGVTADLRTYRASFFWTLREIPATYRALWDIYFGQRVVPLALAPNPIIDIGNGGQYGS